MSEFCLSLVTVIKHVGGGCNGTNVHVLELGSFSAVTGWLIYLIEKCFWQSFYIWKPEKREKILIVTLAMPISKLLLNSAQEYTTNNFLIPGIQTERSLSFATKKELFSHKCFEVQ